MPVNPQTKKLIDKIYKSRTAPIHDLSVEQARKMVLEGDLVMGGKPQEVAQIKDMSIPGSYGDIDLRFYIPKQATKSYSSLLYFFSGGFVCGSIEGSDIICRALANASAHVVIAASYRLAPEYKYPVAINEAYETAKWLFANAEKLNLDSNKISVSGYSAGGTLAALIAIKARNAGLLFANQILVCPWLDLSCSAQSYQRYAYGYLLDQGAAEWFLQHYLPANADTKDPRISPFWETNLKGLPKTLIIAAEFDPLVDENVMYAEKLKAAGVNTKYSCYKGQIHVMLAYRGELEQEENPINEIGIFLQGE